MIIHFKRSICVILIFPTLFIAGCSTTIQKNHPALTHAKDSNSFKLYILRAKQGFNGVRDIPYTIEINDKKLLSIAKGEYTLLHLKPFVGEITVRFWDVTGRDGKNSMYKDSSSTNFSFETQNTYYLTFSVMNSIIVPNFISQSEAYKISKRIKPIGNATLKPITNDSKQKSEHLLTHHADDYPDIKWEGTGIISPDQLSSTLKSKYIATLEVRDKLTGGKYRYLDRFTEEHNGVVLIHHIFQYKEHEKSWLFRDVDPDGKRYENYILVTTWPYKGDGCHHIIYKRGETIEDVYKYVFTKPDVLPEKANQAVVPKSNNCQ